MDDNNQKQNMTPPRAKQISHLRDIHGDKVQDLYFWLNDYFKKGPHADQVIEYLKEENEYTRFIMKDTENIQRELFNEMKSRIKESDQTAPWFKNGYYYYTRTEDNRQYYKFCRKKKNLNSEEEILLDVDEMANGHAYYAVKGFNISPDNTLLAFGLDTLSRRQYQILIKNLKTGELINTGIKNTNSQTVWSSDGKILFYVENNQDTLLSEKIKRHNVGDNPEKDVTVYRENDPTNYIGIGKSKTGKFILLYSGGTLSSEIRYIPADDPELLPQIFTPRMKEVLYHVFALENRFLILTNKGAQNFKLMECPLNKTSVENWKELIPHRKDTLLSDVNVFKNFIVLTERKNGLTKIRIQNRQTSSSYYLDFDEPAYTAGPSKNLEFDTSYLRYHYTSMTTPSSVFQFNLQNREVQLLKQQEVLGDFDPKNYKTERIQVPSRDGKKIPVSIVYSRNFTKTGKFPLLLYGYGSYGATIDPGFSSTRISLLDRGFVFAIAHIRGGEDLGRGWYDNGKMEFKKNTFNDFIDCGKYLVNQKYCHPSQLYAQGGSAGGLLMGVIANEAPELWKGIIAQVPFVDVVNTMLDETIPLTTNEYDEWGNPNIKEQYDYIKSYSPYENIKRQAYPHILVTTGLHDSQVQYFEPAKWIAKLREFKTDNNLLLLKTDMDYGHGGASGRFDYLKEIALNFAFLLKINTMQDL
ncbi:S9 family peptidase [Membranihabitans maritimus]|uniref:S9 family peptidase n=1 Tax=Membranihabitans maritimus TaxID=2904244 RepID=UPI001F3B20E7|nr:S9 family peptidase [Membranihabitans maritimus]